MKKSWENYKCCNINGIKRHATDTEMMISKQCWMHNSKWTGRNARLRVFIIEFWVEKKCIHSNGFSFWFLQLKPARCYKHKVTGCRAYFLYVCVSPIHSSRAVLNWSWATFHINCTEFYIQCVQISFCVRNSQWKRERKGFFILVKMRYLYIKVNERLQRTTDLFVF